MADINQYLSIKVKDYFEPETNHQNEGDKIDQVAKFRQWVISVKHDHLLVTEKKTFCNAGFEGSKGCSQELGNVIYMIQQPKMDLVYHTSIMVQCKICEVQGCH